MGYDNEEPKVLKTLNSSGQVLDDQGNVIHDTSDFWTEKYNQAEPKADKILHSDGTIQDSAGNLIQDTTEYNVQKYNQAEPIPAKYLHSDGTIDENPGSGSGADLEDNKEVTIDVSTYTEPVEIEPTAGKDGMKKATVTLSNIPSGGVSKFYGFFNGSTTALCYCLSPNPSVGDIVYYIQPFSSYGSNFGGRLTNDAEVVFVDIDEETGLPYIRVSSGGAFLRNSNYDLEF